MLIIGESLNATRKGVHDAVNDQDVEFIQKLAVDQVNAGAMMLDVNAAVPGRKEEEDLPWMVQKVQEVVKVPLAIDSANPDAIIAALAVHQGRPMINSISGEEEKLQKLLPIVTETDCDVILLCMDDEGIPHSVDKKITIAKKVIDRLLAKGKSLENVYVDPLIGAAATQPDAGVIAMETIRRIKAEFPGIHTAAGVSNISFGMPTRKLLNRIFLSLCISNGLDGCIVDSRDQELMSSVWATLGLCGQDRFRSYMKAYKKGLLRG